MLRLRNGAFAILFNRLENQTVNRSFIWVLCWYCIRETILRKKKNAWKKWKSVILPYLRVGNSIHKCCHTLIEFQFFYLKKKQTNKHTAAYRISIYRYNVLKWAFSNIVTQFRNWKTVFGWFFCSSSFSLFFFIFRCIVYSPRSYNIHVKVDICLLNEIRCQLFWFENCLDRLHIIVIIMTWEIESCWIVKHRAKRRLRN